MAQKKIKSATDQRKFTLVYNDFLESDLLNYYEKMVFIVLKKYADNETMKAFPSLSKLHKITGISLSQVRRSIEHMKEMGIISVEHRTDGAKGHQSNIYTLYDYAEIWKVGSSEELIAVIDEIEEKRMIELLTAKGYYISKNKGKGLVSEPTKVNPQAPYNNTSDTSKDITTEDKSQALERYSMSDIRSHYHYDELLKEYPERKGDIDTAIFVLKEALNAEGTIRISKQDRPVMSVIGKLLNLEPADIIYALDSFHGQRDRIKNVNGYLLSCLYNAPEQKHLDISNLGHYNGDF